MKWLTLIQAICPESGELKKYSGPVIEAPSWEIAEQYCRENLGYCKVIGEFVGEVPLYDEIEFIYCLN